VLCSVPVTMATLPFTRLFAGQSGSGIASGRSSSWEDLLPCCRSVQLPHPGNTFKRPRIGKRLRQLSAQRGLRSLRCAGHGWMGQLERRKPKWRRAKIRQEVIAGRCTSPVVDIWGSEIRLERRWIAGSLKMWSTEAVPMTGVGRGSRSHGIFSALVWLYQPYCCSDSYYLQPIPCRKHVFYFGMGGDRKRVGTDSRVWKSGRGRKKMYISSHEIQSIPERPPSLYSGTYRYKQFCFFSGSRPGY
jgi:hypothetical protein